MNAQPAKIRHDRPRASVIIPAYNEAQVINRCLRALLYRSAPGEFDIVVVCNGCSDDTEMVARQVGPEVRVFTIEQASKTAALNFGDRMAKSFPRVYIDADLEITGDSVRRLIDALDFTQSPAAIGFMDVDTRQCPWSVRKFYQLWGLHPYLTRGKFGGVYALSEVGWLKRGQYPHLVADDDFVRRKFQVNEVAVVPDCRFRVFAPRTLSDVARIRSRTYLGNLQLKDKNYRASPGMQGGTLSWLQGVLRNPASWFGVPAYVTVNAVAKINAMRLHRRRQFDWIRDESSRQIEHAPSSL